ncbi:MAG: FtsX-like permease family protein, partial [Actinocrinis sp.]
SRSDSTIGRSGTGGHATLLGVDPSLWPRVAVLRSDLAPGGAAGLVAPLRAHTVAEPGLVLPGRPRSLTLTVRLTGASGAAVSGGRVDVTIGAASGEPQTLSAPLAATAADQRVKLDLTPAIGNGAQVAWPLRIVRIGVEMPTPSSGTAKAGFDVLTAVADTGPATLPAGQGWTAVASVDVPTTAGAQYDLTAVRDGGAAQGTAGGSALLHGTFDPGTVPPSVGLPGHSSYSAGVEVPSPAAVPAVATPQFLAATGAHVGSTVVVTANGGDLLLDVVGEARSIPTTRPGDDAVLIDQGALDAYGAAHAFSLFGGGELWISTQPGAASQVAAKLLSTGLSSAAQDRFSVAADLIDDPVRGGPLGALTIAAWAAVLFALFGYGAHVAAVLRERVPQLAAVRALGVGAARIGAAFGVEQALVAVVGVLAGGAVGLLLSELVVPATVLARDGRAPIPPVLVDLDWVAVGWSGAAVIAVVAAAGTWAALLAPRLHIASLLRAGDAG